MSKARKIATCLNLAEGCAQDARRLLSVRSRNAAYLAEQAAEHLITAVATAEDLHIERRDAHQLDTIVRRIPSENPDKSVLGEISFLEAFATSYRYGTPTGRIPEAPGWDRIEGVLDTMDALLAGLRAHFGVPTTRDGSAMTVSPRR